MPEIKWTKDNSPLHIKKRLEIVQGGTLKIDGESKNIFLMINILGGEIIR